MNNNFVSYVINLEKRTDRIENFKKRYELYGPYKNSDELVIVKAVNGLGKGLEGLEDKLPTLESLDSNNFISRENDFDSCPRVSACALSHINVWSMIAESGKNGIVYEDDINFREDGLFKRKYNKILWDIENVLSKEKCIVYLGAGDILPIHINIKSESLMRAQEKSHIKDFINDSVGTPNTKTAFIFNWFGAFSYSLSPDTAKYLLSCIKLTPIKTAIDVYLKCTLKQYITWPLLTYHDRIETCDSDIKRVQRKLNV